MRSKGRNRLPLAKDASSIAHLAAGISPAGAAKLAGVSEATANRRLANPAFRQRVEDARAELWKRAMAVLSKSAVEGALVLRRLLRSDDAKVRLQAAKTVLEQGIKVRDQVDIAQRVEELEKAVQERKARR